MIDGIGNVYGRSPDATRSILVGSHSDSVPNGGWLDGALGVVYALEVARAARGARGAIGIDVVSFADEEGTWLPLSRQQHLLRRRRRGYVARCAKKDRRTIGGSIDAAWTARPAIDLLRPERHRAYLEAHIEQGPRLIGEAVDIGIVTGIVGLRRHVVRFRGRADHAGTTPMAMRRDAAFAMFIFAIALAERLRAAGGPESVWNFGIVAVRPGPATSCRPKPI